MLARTEVSPSKEIVSSSSLKQIMHLFARGDNILTQPVLSPSNETVQMKSVSSCMVHNFNKNFNNLTFN